MNPTNNNSVPWSFDANKNFVPILHEGTVVGFLRPDYAQKVAQVLNAQDRLHAEQDRLRKSLRLACFDLLRQGGGDTKKVEELMKQYAIRVERPKHGPRAVAFLLRDRQEELQVGNEEFIKFCDTLKVSRQQITDLFAGKPIEESAIVPLARILGKTPAEVKSVLKGPSEGSGEH